MNGASVQGALLFALQARSIPRSTGLCAPTDASFAAVKTGDSHMSAVMEEDFERWTARRNAALVLALVMSVTSMAAMAGPVEGWSARC